MNYSSADASRSRSKDLKSEMAEASKAAFDALHSLNESDITELQMDKRILPTSGLQTVFEAVMILLNEDKDWENIQKVVIHPSFLKRLHQLNKDDIPFKLLLFLKHEYLSDKDSFHVQRMLRLGSVSKVATALCQWVHALVSYSEKKRKSEIFLLDNQHNNKRFENITCVDTKW